MILGISGKSGAGKSSISAYIESHYGFKWIDTDELARKIRESNIEEIVSLVSNKEIIKDGKVDSKLLGAILFDNKHLLDEYNKLIYLKLKDYLESEISKYEDVIVDSLFLPIMDVFSWCDYKIFVDCDDDVRKERIIKRDSISQEYFSKRDENGLIYNKNDFDFVIVNNDDYTLSVKEVMGKIKR